MDTITVKFWDKKSITIDDIDLYTLTPLQLIKRMIIDKHLPDSEQAECYTILDKENKVIIAQISEKTLEQLGFRNGDTVTIVKKHTYVQDFTYIPAPTSPAIEELESIRIKLREKEEKAILITIQEEKLLKEGNDCIENLNQHTDEALNEIYRIKTQLEHQNVDWLDIQNSLNHVNSLINTNSYLYEHFSKSLIGSRMADLDYEFSLGGFFLSAVASSLIGATTACLFRSKKAKISSMLNEYIDNIHTIQQKVERDINSKIVNFSSSKQLLCNEINILKNNLKYLWNQIQSKEAYASVFCPAKIQKKSHLLVQVYVHSFSETEKVIELSKESQKKAERRDYIPLAHNLRKGDKVDIQLNITGETLLKTEMKSLVWNGSFNKCTFDFFVPADIEVNELSCKTILCVNNLPIGELVFTTTIADISSNMLTEVKSHKYKKIFISYSHKDEDKVRFLSEGFNMLDIPHFFDRKSLKAGDIFPEEIQKYIETADLFVLCWSENAAKSDYVALERRCALQRAYPQIKPQHEAKLSIYPLNIKPKAELPNDMKGKYHFGEFN